MKYNQKKKKENIEIFLFIMVMAVFAAVLGVMSLGEKMQPVNQIRKISSGWYYYDNGKKNRSYSSGYNTGRERGRTDII